MKRELIIVDLDGTLCEFENVDHKIINDIFKKSKAVLLLDKLLWRINRLDLISNSFAIFKLRIAVYSMMSFSNYLINMKTYKKMYYMFLKDVCVSNYYKYLHSFNNSKVEVLLLTHDSLAREFLKDVNLIVTRNKNSYIPSLLKYYDIKAIVGNNFCDDILSAYKVNKIYKKRMSKRRATIVYVGNSSLVKLLTKNKVVNILDISDILKIF